MLLSLKACKFTPVLHCNLPTSFSRGFSVPKHNLPILKSVGVQIVPYKNTHLVNNKGKLLHTLTLTKDLIVIQKRFFNQTPIPRSWRDAVFKEDRYRNDVVYRSSSDFWNSSYLLYALIGANVFVFLLWNTYGTERSGYRTMTQNFMVSWKNVSEGRVWTLITSTISHQQPFHLLFNMLGLYFFGNTILNVCFKNTFF